MLKYWHNFSHPFPNYTIIIHPIEVDEEQDKTIEDIKKILSKARDTHHKMEMEGKQLFCL